MANNRNDDAPEDERREPGENDADNTQEALGQPLKESALVTKRPGIKPS